MRSMSGPCSNQSKSNRWRPASVTAVPERQTKIVATMGPAVASPEKVRELVAAGVDVARLNFSHGDHDFHRQFADWVREAAKAEDRVVAILQDIQGPKIRVGSFPGGSMPLSAGSTVEIRAGRGLSTDGSIEIDYEFLIEDVEAGEQILLADGLIRLVVIETKADSLTARIVQGGVLSDGKGVAFPETSLRVPAMTAKDEVDLDFGREIEVDYVAASFVRTGEDVRIVKARAGKAPVIAKIELALAYENLDDIMEMADGVMVARGDLGVQVPLERIPLIQADILRRANAAGLISITATEMLESMTKASRPTRAEVTDVANAVLTGTDAVMLSAETAIGDYPVLVVQTMARICAEVEKGDTRESQVDFIRSGGNVASAVARAAVEAAIDLDVATIVAFTESGSTARIISQYRPRARIIAFTPERGTLARMALYRGVRAFHAGRREYTDVMIAAAEKFLEKRGLCKRGDTVVMVAGTPPNQQASTNLMKIHVIGERDAGARSLKTGRTSPEGGSRS